jgi:hypothetical protein
MDHRLKMPKKKLPKITIQPPQAKSKSQALSPIPPYKKSSTEKLQNEKEVFPRRAMFSS